MAPERPDECPEWTQHRGKCRRAAGHSGQHEDGFDVATQLDELERLLVEAREERDYLQRSDDQETRQHSDTLREAADYREALERLRACAAEVRAHYGIEECGGPGQDDTDWDRVQYDLAGAVRDVDSVLARYPQEPAQENIERMRELTKSVEERNRRIHGSGRVSSGEGT